MVLGTFDSFFKDFDEIIKSWNRPIIESKGWKVIPNSNGYLVVANTVGVSKDNIKIELSKNVLTLSGHTEVKDISFTNSVNYKWDVSEFGKQIIGIEYEVVDGLTYIEILTEKPKEKEIRISYKETKEIE
jgi:HSP20 family molecular chaperone IbpA